jgi:hypothetical protein
MRGQLLSEYSKDSTPGILHSIIMNLHIVSIPKDLLLAVLQIITIEHSKSKIPRI